MNREEIQDLVRDAVLTAAEIGGPIPIQPEADTGEFEWSGQEYQVLLEVLTVEFGQPEQELWPDDDTVLLATHPDEPVALFLSRPQDQDSQAVMFVAEKDTVHIGHGGRLIIVPPGGDLTNRLSRALVLAFKDWAAHNKRP